MRRLILGPLIVVLLLIPPVDTAQAYDCSSVPVGSWSGAAPAIQHPIWCVALPNTAPTTRQLDAQGGWLDDFHHGTQFAHFTEGDSGYHVNGVIGGSGAGPDQSTHWLHNNHWMVDFARNNSTPAGWNTNMGTAISPQQAFYFENGKLILETDVAAGISGYETANGGDIVWPEAVWSTASAPTGNVVDSLYLYGHYGGAWAGGCRLQAKRSLTCALEADHPIGSLSTNDQPPCFGVGPSRLIELSGFQQCGSVHDGLDVAFGSQTPSWRSCGANDPDTNCRDRFRFEWSKDGLRTWVNGVFFGEDRGWPLARQIPDSIVNGSTPVYAHFGEFGFISDANAYRFHWQRVMVNGHDASGAILPLSAAPSFCPGQPGDTCAAAPSPTPTPTPTPSATPTPTPSPSPTPTPAPTPFPCTLNYGGADHLGNCLQQANGTVVFSPS